LGIATISATAFSYFGSLEIILPESNAHSISYGTQNSVKDFLSKISVKIVTDSAKASSGNSFVTNGFALNGNFSGAWGWKHGAPLASQYRFNPLDPEHLYG
jgi:hypothetical protein